MDDEPLLCAIFQEMLQEEGFDVLIANNGKIGLEVLESSNVDCILVDLDMPVMSGNEFILHYQANGGTCPIIILSGKRVPEENIQGKVVEILNKPFSFTTLLESINTALFMRSQN
ncbi:MAG: response regulator [Desulfovibrionales bacterium]